MDFCYKFTAWCVMSWPLAIFLLWYMEWRFGEGPWAGNNYKGRPPRTNPWHCAYRGALAANALVFFLVVTCWITRMIVQMIMWSWHTAIGG